MDRYTLHIRLTHACNADCSYCSSRVAGVASHMKTADFEKACRFIADELLPLLGHKGREGHISIQYVGGEILTVPYRTLSAQVDLARGIFAQRFLSVRDGAQSNLIGSAARVAALDNLFEGRVGTSIDNHTDQRTAKGSSQIYKKISTDRQNELRNKRGRPVSGVLVVDAASLPFVRDEVLKAMSEGYALTLRTVFAGGSDIAPANVEAVRLAYLAAAEDWLGSFAVPIEPFHQLFAGRLARKSGDISLLAQVAGCPFQSDCARYSLNLEPDGGLYICQDMADSGQFRLGNAIDGRFETGLWGELDQRRQHLDEECRSCPWRRECQGGCMSEAIHHTGSIYGRTKLCPVWKALFARFDRFIQETGVDAARRLFDRTLDRAA